MKNVFQNKKYCEKCDIYIFASLFTVLLDKKTADFHNCCYIQFVVICLKYMKKTQPYPDT